MSSIAISDRKLDEYLHRIDEPHIFGPGYWRMLHQDAYDAETKEEIEFFIKRLARRLGTIPCGICREHALKYLAENPIERYRGVKGGVFKWTVDFHNAVNARLGKLKVDLETAKKFYANTEPCKSCGRDEEIPIVSIIPVTTR